MVFSIAIWIYNFKWTIWCILFIVLFIKWMERNVQISWSFPHPVFWLRMPFRNLDIHKTNIMYVKLVLWACVTITDDLHVHILHWDSCFIYLLANKNLWISPYTKCYLSTTHTINKAYLLVKPWKIKRPKRGLQFVNK